MPPTPFQQEGTMASQRSQPMWSTSPTLSDDDNGLNAITDSACSRTLAGSGWLQRYRDLADRCGIKYVIITQDEVFKFGGSKLYPSKKALVAWFNIKGSWALVKISEVQTQVPLLLSRPVLGALGMHYDMEANTADFTRMGLKGVRLGSTESRFIRRSRSPAPGASRLTGPAILTGGKRRYGFRCAMEYIWCEGKASRGHLKLFTDAFSSPRGYPWALNNFLRQSISHLKCFFIGGSLATSGETSGLRGRTSWIGFM